MRILNNCTLYTVNCIQPELAVIALLESSKDILFKEIIIFSDVKPINITDKIKFIKIDTIKSLEEYSAFMLLQLVNYINTDFCFCIHHDGWIINSNNWKDEFLHYDYIGAPWPVTAHFLPPGEKYRVGNGGVSIRSKKLLDTIKDMNLDPKIWCYEDTFIVHTIRDNLESKGISFAPINVAKYFSYELECEDLNITCNDVLAFHGKAHTPSHKEYTKNILSIYYRDVITKLSKDKVLDWLYNEAGSQDPNTFFGKFRGNFELQQIPKEYINLLEFFRNTTIKSYLELGVGNGSSFFVNSLFIGDKCKTFNAVDSIAYANTHIKQTEEKILKKVNMLSKLFPTSNVKFFNNTTDNFFKTNTNTYDCIFIDADHEYEGVKQDYLNSLKILNKGGTIIFHDIGNEGTGVAKLWREITHNTSKTLEFLWKPDGVSFYDCGIGIISI